MKNKLLHGALTVSKFTLQQHYKALSVKILLLILMVIGFCAVPLLRMVFEKEEDVNVELPDVSTIYLRNDTEYPIDTADLAGLYTEKTVVVNETDTSDENFAELIASGTDILAISISETEENGGVGVQLFYSEDGEISSDSVQLLSDSTADFVYRSMLEVASATDDQSDILRASVRGDVKEITEYVTDDSETDMAAHTGINLAYCYLVMILSTLSMSYILALAVEEKQSKLVETFLLSVSPSQMLLGKFIAVTVFIFVGIFLTLGSFGISLLIAKSQGGIAFLTHAIESMGAMEVLKGIGVPEIILLVVSVLLAYTMIAFIAAIFGSCCSKTDDIQHASMSLVFVIMFGYMAGAMVPLFESQAANIITSLFPLTGIFSVPVNYICGKINLPILMISLLIQVITIFFLIRAAGKVYQMMILYRGDFPKLKQLIGMLRAQSAAEKEGKTK